MSPRKSCEERLEKSDKTKAAPDERSQGEQESGCNWRALPSRLAHGPNETNHAAGNRSLPALPNEPSFRWFCIYIYFFHPRNLLTTCSGERARVPPCAPTNAGNDGWPYSEETKGRPRYSILPVWTFKPYRGNTYRYERSTCWSYIRKFY